MTKYKIRLDYHKKRGKISHRKENFDTIFHRIINLTKKQNLMMTKYEEDYTFAYITLEPI